MAGFRPERVLFRIGKRRCCILSLRMDTAGYWQELFQRFDRTWGRELRGAGDREGRRVFLPETGRRQAGARPAKERPGVYWEKQLSLVFPFLYKSSPSAASTKLLDVARNRHPGEACPGSGPSLRSGPGLTLLTTRGAW